MIGFDFYKFFRVKKYERDICFFIVKGIIMVFCFCYCLGIERLISKFIIVNDFIIVYILFFGCFYNILMKNS